MTKHAQEKFAERLMLLEIFLHASLPIGLNYGAKLLPQIQFLAYLTLIASIFFFFITLYKKQFHHLKNKKNLLPLFLYTLAIPVIPYGIIVYASRYTSAINTTIFIQVEIFYAVIFGWFILKEKIQKPKLLAVILIFLANLAVAYNGTLHFNLADLAMILAPISFVYGNVIAKKLQKDGVGWPAILFFRSLLGGLILLAVAAFIEDITMPPQSLWFFLLWFSLLTFVIDKAVWQIALHRMDISKVTAIGMTYPVPSFIIAYFWLGEIPNNYQWFAIFLISIAIYLLLQTTSKQYEEL